MRYRLARMAAIGGAALISVLFARRRSLHWGATGRESGAVLPGDELMPNADLVSTRVVTVRTSADQVWPWIAQLGQGRGGFYSYDRLENLLGCDIHSADGIVPQWQDLGVGDDVNLHPDVSLEVVALESGRWFVLRGGVPMGETPPPYDFTWAFVLQERPDGTTRLLVRERYAYTRRWAPLLVEPVAQVSFVMSRKMLRGIKDRAERIAARPLQSATTNQGE